MRVSILALRFGPERECLPPLGALLLAGAVRRAGHDAEVVDGGADLRLTPFAVRELSRAIAELQGEVVALSIFHDAVPLVVACLKEYPKCTAGRRILIGGPGSTGVEADLLDALPQVTDVVRGDGETALCSLLDGPDRARRMPGVYSRGASGLVTGHGSSPREDMRQLPAIDWSLLGAHQYSAVPIASMRGCPYDCSFCEVVATFGRAVRFRDPADVIGDIVAGTTALRTDVVRLIDDTFNVSRKHMHHMCSMISEQTPSIRFSAYARIEQLREDDVTLLLNAGCERLFVGIDVLDAEAQTTWSKGYSRGSVVPRLEALSRMISVSMSMMWGFPEESYSTFSDGLDAATQLLDRGHENVWPQYSLVSPSVETPLYRLYSDRLLLDLDAPLLPIGCSLSEAARFSGDGDAAVDVIQRSPRLGAAFYRFATPDFDRKLDDVRLLRDRVSRRIGKAVMQHVEGDDAH